MHTKRKLSMVSNGDDWKALYVDDVLWGQGHEITAQDICEALDINLNSHISTDADVSGRFPDSFKEIKDLQDY